MKFAVFTDLHYDAIHDGDRRIHEFLHSVKEEKIDFIIELGDFCHPTDANKHLIKKLKEVGIPCFFNIGNHNSDAYSINAVLKFFGMEKITILLHMEMSSLLFLMQTTSRLLMDVDHTVNATMKEQKEIILIFRRKK